MNCPRESLRLYAVTDRHWLGAKTLAQAVEEALRGGATMVQLREKNLDHDRFLAEALAIKSVAKRYGAPLIINDRVEIALACDADGVHLGQDDADPRAARLLGGLQAEQSQHQRSAYDEDDQSFADRPPRRKRRRNATNRIIVLSGE